MLSMDLIRRPVTRFKTANVPTTAISPPPTARIPAPTASPIGPSLPRDVVALPSPVVKDEKNRPPISRVACTGPTLCDIRLNLLPSPRFCRLTIRSRIRSLATSRTMSALRLELDALLFSEEEELVEVLVDSRITNLVARLAIDGSLDGPAAPLFPKSD